jgi:hypothetical protein
MATAPKPPVRPRPPIRTIVVALDQDRVPTRTYVARPRVRRAPQQAHAATTVPAVGQLSNRPNSPSTAAPAPVAVADWGIRTIVQNPSPPAPAPPVVEAPEPAPEKTESAIFSGQLSEESSPSINREPPIAGAWRAP